MRKIMMSGAALVALALAACGPTGGSAAGSGGKKDVETFLKETDQKITEFYEYAARIQWVNATYINDDTDWLAAKVNSEGNQLSVEFANATKQFDGQKLTDDQARQLRRLKMVLMPAPSSGTPEEQKKINDELAQVSKEMETLYATGKFTIDGKPRTLDDLSEVIGSSRDPKKLKEAWEGWRTVSPPMAKNYARMVEIGTAGAKELGYNNLADLWLSNYDMPPADMEKTVERLWGQVEPLYKELHCYTRGRLNAKYGDAVQPKTGPIRADLLGNMWAQDWMNIYPLVAPKGADKGYDLTAILKQRGFTAEKMVKTGEGFYTSLGLPPLPDTFWKRSMITRPADREVVCHASAWDIDNKDDIRIKMCTNINAEDFSTVHHELGHNFYQRAYNKQPIIYRDGANDGFHEAIGDFIALSVTPEYLKQIGLLDKLPPASADTGLLMDRALEKIAFLPFGLMMDKWRWQVFRGETTPADYNKAWWDLALKYQGIAPPGPRPADAFDPGAKYHIAANVPYLRYFLSFVLQFQFQKAACEQAGWTGPLHRCSIYGNKEVGAKFAKMMEMGASKPWPDALEAFTGTREIDGSAIVSYFEPLMVYLKEQNKGQSCGW